MRCLRCPTEEGTTSTVPQVILAALLRPHYDALDAQKVAAFNEQICKSTTHWKPFLDMLNGKECAKLVKAGAFFHGSAFLDVLLEPNGNYAPYAPADPKAMFRPEILSWAAESGRFKQSLRTILAQRRCRQDFEAGARVQKMLAGKSDQMNVELITAYLLEHHPGRMRRYNSAISKQTRRFVETFLIPVFKRLPEEINNNVGEVNWAMQEDSETALPTYCEATGARLASAAAAGGGGFLDTEAPPPYAEEIDVETKVSVPSASERGASTDGFHARRISAQVLREPRTSATPVYISAAYTSDSPHKFTLILEDWGRHHPEGLPKFKFEQEGECHWMEGSHYPMVIFFKKQSITGTRQPFVMIDSETGMMFPLGEARRLRPMVINGVKLSQRRSMARSAFELRKALKEEVVNARLPLNVSAEAETYLRKMGVETIFQKISAESEL